MAYIKVKVDYPIKDGVTFTFHAPCNCSDVDGITVQHPDGVTHFAFKDTHGNDLTGLNNLFTTGAMVMAVLDVTNGAAFLQNADTNGYLERQIDIERSRINELAACRSLAANEYTFTDDVLGITVTIKTSGSFAKLRLNISGDLALGPGEQWVFTKIPKALAPFDVVVIESFFLGDIVCTLQTGTGEDYAPLLFYNRSSEQVTPNAFAEVDYHLGSVFISELSDIRVGYDDTTYSTAGEAVRAIGNRVETVDARMESISAGLQKMIRDNDTAIMNLETEVKNARLDHKGTTHGSAGDAIRAVGTRMETLATGFNKRITDNETDIMNLQSNVNALTTTVNGHADNIAGLESGVDALTKTVSGHTDTINTLVSDVSLARTDVKILDKNAKALTQKVNSNSKTLKELPIHKIEDYAFAVCDKDGNVTFAVDNAGKPVFVSDNADIEEEMKKLLKAMGNKLNATETDDYAYAVCDENGNVVFAITHDGEVLPKQESGGTTVVSGTAVDFSKCGLPVLYLEGSTDGMTKEDAVELNYTFKNPKNEVVTSGICECKWQGSSSVSRGYPKRNYTLKFYKSEKVDGELVKNKFEATSVFTYDGDRVVNFDRPWGEQYKYCAKANWIDPSGARNVVCARLWGAIVADRAANYGTVPEKLLTAPNYGAVNGFPIIIIINDEFTGLYTFNIPKDDWTFNMGDGDGEYVVGCESNDNAYPSCRWSGLATFEDEEDYAIEVIPDGVDDSVLIDSFNDAIQNMIDAEQYKEGWTEHVAEHFDVEAAIDYMIFTCCIGGRDNRRKNILYGTYDGQKWFMSAYDLDTTFGANVHNKGWYEVINNVNQFKEMSTWHRVFSYIYKYSKDRLKARYAELRSTILSDENVWYMLNNFVSDIPLVIYNMDAERWCDKLDNAPPPGIKKPMLSTATANVNNYMHYYRMHCAYLDKEIEAL